MCRASELLQQMEQEGFPRKAMADVTGQSYTQTCKYVNGDLNVPTEFLNGLFRATGDLRLVDLITRGRPVLVHQTDITLKPITPDMLAALIETRKHELDREQYVLQIMSDGKVDRSDAQAVENFKREFWESIRHATQVYNAITAQFDQVK